MESEKVRSIFLLFYNLKKKVILKWFNKCIVKTSSCAVIIVGVIYHQND